MRPDEVTNVVVLGDVMVGKTAIVQRMCSGFYEPEYVASESDVFVHSVTYGQTTRHFRVFDSAGMCAPFCVETTALLLAFLP